MFNSPAIDAGDNYSVLNDEFDLDQDGITSEPVPIDMDGYERFFEMPVQPNVGNGDFPLVDMGAYEVYNSAPALDNSGDPHLQNTIEDQGNSQGTLVSDLIASGAGGDPITDPDPSPIEGIAVIGADNGNGYWQCSIDGGTSWSNLGSPSNTAAVLIGDDPVDRIRFVPNINFNGTITGGLIFRAWDRSDGFPDGSSGVNLFITGDASPYSSATETASITVLPVNDSPTMNSVPTQTVYEDSGPASVLLTGIGSGDPDESQTITITASSNNPGLIPSPTLDYVSPEPTATLSYEPVADQFGTATITVIVMDDGGTENGGSDTLVRTFQIVVSPVNDHPYFDKGTDPVVLEDSGQTTITGWATNISPGPPNEASQTLTFILTPDNPGLFSVQPAINTQTGTLTFTPAQNATGSTPVTAVLKDNGGTSNGGEDSYTRVFTISIDPVNDPPSFIAGSNPVVLEDSGTQTIDNWTSSIMPGPQDENWQSLSFTITPDDTGLFASPLTINSSTGDLSFTPATDAIGSSSVLVELVDNGGTANGGSDTFTTSFEITIEPVNDPPSVSLGEDPTVSEDSGTQIFGGWATNISPGPDDEALQSLTFSLTAANPSLFASQPTIQSSTGTLSFSTSPNANGVTEINMTLKDSGGTANGGDDASTYTFAITVNPVNDKPEVTTFSKTGLWNQLLDFSSSDFGSNFTDIDGDDLTRVKITSLPTHGTLLVNGTSVYSGQEMLYSDLDLLAFSPSAGWEGTTSLSWNGSDGTEYSSADAEVDITISSVIIPPIAKQLFVPLVLFNQNVTPPPLPTPTPTPTLVPTPTPTPTPPATWVNIMTEDFEGSFPSGWQLYGAGEYLWAKRNCRPFAGNYSGWAVGGGANGNSLSCESYYPDDAASWMIYGPFDLQGTTAALLTFKLWAYIEGDYDEFCVGASLDNDDYYGWCGSGDSNGWIDEYIDLNDVYSLGSLLNKPQVWIAFTFESDFSINYPEGVYIDNITLKKCQAPSGCSSTALTNPKDEQTGFFTYEKLINKK